MSRIRRREAAAAAAENARRGRVGKGSGLCNTHAPARLQQSRPTRGVARPAHFTPWLARPPRRRAAGQRPPQ